VRVLSVDKLDRGSQFTADVSRSVVNTGFCEIVTGPEKPPLYLRIEGVHSVMQ
jgi:hypothetical protein